MRLPLLKYDVLSFVLIIRRQFETNMFQLCHFYGFKPKMT
jgi:hypothetical protein